MRKYALLSLCDNTTRKLFDKSTFPYMQNYCDFVDADLFIYGEDADAQNWIKTHEIIDQFKWGVNAKFKYLKELFKQYERILIIDADVLILKTAPNIFNIVPTDCIGACNEFHNRQYSPRQEEMVIKPTKIYNEILIRHGRKPYDLKKWDGAYFNNGIMVVSREHVDIFEEPLEYFSTKTHIQDYTNFLFRYYNVKMFDLPYEFNRFMIGQPTIATVESSYFLHFAAVYADYSVRCMVIDEVATLLKEKNLL